MGYRYLILGAGRQGTACAYDLARFGEADRIILADANRAFAQKSVERLRRLLFPSNKTGLEAVAVSVQDHSSLVKVMSGADAMMSAVPYYFNPLVAKAAIEAAVPMCDLGGDIQVVQEERRLSDAAQTAGISIIPDCGLAPGMNNLL
ncbi:MAG TPA: saccharopine dehydrogenase NADP-binding domain-containing protein, partial [Nitrospiria bacterium]